MGRGGEFFPNGGGGRILPVYCMLYSVPIRVYRDVGAVAFQLKGTVSRDFEWLQMILMSRLCVPDIPLEVNCFLNLHLHIAF